MSANDPPAIILKRENHEEKTIEMFKQLKNALFADVSLASEDNKSISVHKTILSYSSPYLYSILHTNASSSQIILPIKYFHLQSLVEYIYLGKTRMEGLQVKEFLDIANILQIRGLCSDDRIRKTQQLGKVKIQKC